MSSNAFARSRPRVRHQRVPKTPSYAHPRFLKLVKELVRIDEAKTKATPSSSSSSNKEEISERDNAKQTSGEESSSTTGDDDCSNINNPVAAHQMISQISSTSSRHGHHHSHHHHHHHHHHSHPSRHQQPNDVICCPGLSRLNYPSCVSEPNTSNGYRSLDMNQSTSALHDNYYRQNDNSDNQHQQQPQVTSSMHHQGYPVHQQRHYSYPSNQHDSFSQPSGAHHSHQLDYRSLNKCPSSSTSSNQTTGFTKSGPIQQSNIQLITNSEPDPRQDENRSKRKRSGTDTSAAAKKSSPSSSSTSACNKRHKSSPEPPRPLSPSFTKCPICLLDCMDRDPSFTNTCFHLFCFVCIENWSKSKATCPLCRTKFSKIIYNIRSESCFEEKVASPLRRDDDDDRFTYEQLSAHSMIHSRSAQAEEARLLFDNLRNNDVLMPHLVFTNQIDPRQVDLHSFNSITNNANFSSAVPHAPFTSTSYNPVGSNYIALLPSNSRLQTNPTGPAITSAYPSNASLTNISSDTSNRIPRVSRSGRYIYSRNYDLADMDSSARGSRSTNQNLNQPGIPLDSRPHHHLLANNPSQHHQQHNHHHQQQHRSTIPTTIELAPARQSHHPSISLPYPIPTRHYTNPNLYARRPYTNPPIEQHILDELYTQIPEM